MTIVAAPAADRVQLPFTVLPGTLCGFPYTVLRYEADVDVPNGGSRRITLEVRPGPLATAILDLMRLYNDQQEIINAMQKEYDRDQRTIAQMQGMIEKLENKLRGHETARPKKTGNGV